MSYNAEPNSQLLPPGSQIVSMSYFNSLNLKTFIEINEGGQQGNNHVLRTRYKNMLTLCFSSGNSQHGPSLIPSLSSLAPYRDSLFLL